jgi:hypothetical protein
MRFSPNTSLALLSAVALLCALTVGGALAVATALARVLAGPQADACAPACTDGSSGARP